MKKLFQIFIVILLSVLFTDIYAQKSNEYIPPGGARLMVQVNGNDTVLLAYLHDIWVFPRNNFKNKAQEQYFWLTVRDIKRTLPYAKLIAGELTKTNMKLASMKTDAERKKYMSQYEKEIFKKYEADLKKMTINQGRLLMKLVDRECNKTTYDLIKAYKGSFSAFFWQGVARLFGSNLKSEYDAANQDKMVERIVVLVEAGQL